MSLRLRLRHRPRRLGTGAVAAWQRLKGKLRQWTTIGTIRVSGVRLRGHLTTRTTTAIGSGRVHLGWARLRGFLAMGTTSPVTASITGTATTSIWYESDVVTGGRTLILTLTGDTFVASGATFNAIRQALIDGIVAAASPPNGWNAVRASIPVTAIVRTSATVATLTLPPLPSYSVTANQTLTWTVPGSALVSGNAVVATPALTVTGGSPTVLFQEGFESGTLTGWIDDTSVPIVTDNRTGSAGTKAMEWAWANGASTPTGVASCRRDFTPTDRVYLSYWVKHSSNWVGSGYADHPHLFHFLTDVDDHYIGPASTHLTTYDELHYGSGGMTYRMILQDSLNIDTGNLGVNLTEITEDRSIGGYNGQPESGFVWDTYLNAPGDYRNSKSYITPSNVLTDANKTQWHHIESYWQINTIVGGIGQPNGVMQLWVDGVQVLNRSDVYFRTNKNPTMKFRTFVMAPYIGGGAPVAQSMWIDDVTVSTGRTESGSTSLYVNEPSGMTALFADPMQELPNGPGPGQWDWDNSPGDVPPTAGTDDSPLTEHYCWDYKYPAGMTGGQSPCRSLSQVPITPQTNGYLYQCVVFKYPSNWTNSSNNSTKFGIVRHGGSSNHVWKCREGSGTGGITISFATQGGGENSQYDGRPGVDVIPHDTWAKMEILCIMNNPAGTANGTMRIWYSLWNGSSWNTPTEALFQKQFTGPYISRQNSINWAGSGQSRTWNSIVHDPTYGGGLNPVPYDMTLKIAHWYASSK